MPTRSPDQKAARQEAIRRLIRTRAVATQDELGQLLAGEGFAVTQATLSRDLAQLGAMRVSRPGNGTIYGLEPSPPPNGEARLRELGQMVLAVDHSDALVVIKTEPGAASAVALALDLARLTQALGSLAGDDTIFVAPSRGNTPKALARRLGQLLGKEPTR
jgi:transcriptional regulator of arginine metabolism